MRTLSIFWASVLIVALGASDLHAQLRRADRARERGDLQEALRHIDAALEKDAEDVRALESRAKVFKDSAGVSEGTVYLEALQQMADDFVLVAEMDAKRRDLVAVQLQQIWVQEFNRGIQAFNDAQTATDSLEKQMHFASAINLFRATTIVAPDSSTGYVNWAFALISSGDDAGAIEPLQHSLRTSEPDTLLYDYLSRILLTNDRTEEAVEVLEEAVEHFPDVMQLQNNLLSAYNMSGQIDRALARYSEAIELNPTNTTYRYNYGSLLLQEDRFDEAIDVLTAAVEMDSSNPDAFYNLGAAYVNKAVAINDEISAMDDRLRDEADSLTEEEVAEARDAIDLLVEERRELFAQAIGPLERAKALAEAGSGADASTLMGTCAALWQSYTQTLQDDLAEGVAECAGY